MQLIAALDDWAIILMQLRAGSEEPLRVVARLADDDPWRQQLRDPEVRKDQAALERLARAEGVLSQPPGNLTLLSRSFHDGEGREPRYGCYVGHSSGIPRTSGSTFTWPLALSMSGRRGRRRLGSTEWR